MNIKKSLLAGGLIVALTLAIPATQALGAEPTPPTDLEKIVGPTMWAVGVVDCKETPFFTLRIKKIEGCEVDTDPLSGTLNSCPSDKADVLYYRIPAGEVFGLPCEAIITKVKNFKAENDLFSFDAQIQFVVTKASGLEECTTP